MNCIGRAAITSACLTALNHAATVAHKVAMFLVIILAAQAVIIPVVPHAQAALIAAAHVQLELKIHVFQVLVMAKLLSTYLVIASRLMHIFWHEIPNVLATNSD